MGEAKRRKQLDSNFGKVYSAIGLLAEVGTDKAYAKTATLLPILSCCEHFSSVELPEHIKIVQGLTGGDESIMQAFNAACTAYPKLALAWLEATSFADRITRTHISVKEAAEYWVAYWGMFVPILGAIDLRSKDKNLSFLLLRLNGLWMYNLDTLNYCFSKQAADFGRFMKQTNPLLDMGGVTIQAGLIFQLYPENIFYCGDTLLVYRGGDGSDNSGELMIAVKHQSGCWNHYPNPDNLKIPLSEYKRAKATLASLKIPMKGELIHSQSYKLVKLLGLNVEGNYAYLVCR